MARLKNRGPRKPARPDARGYLRDRLVKYRNEVIARNGPGSILLANPTFRRIDALDAGESVRVLGYEVAYVFPPGAIDHGAAYTLTKDNTVHEVTHAR